MTTPSAPATPRRGRARRAVAPLVGLLALGGASALAEAPPPGNPVANPSFERDPGTDWTGFRASFGAIALPAGEAPHGTSAVQVTAGPDADGLEGYAIDDVVPSGGTVPVGTQFVATAYMRAQSMPSIGKPGKVWVRERIGQDLVARVSGEAPLTPVFQLITSPVYTTQRAGSEIDVYVAQNPAAPGDVFAADVVALSRNLPPAGTISISDASPAVGATVTFSSATVTDPERIGVATRTWDVTGDGAFADGTGVTASRTFGTAGTYPIRVRTADTNGATSVISTSITVTRTGAPGNGPIVPPGSRPQLTRFKVTTRNRVSVAAFRLSHAVRLGTRIERKRVGRAGYVRVKSPAGRRVAAGARKVTLGRRLAAGRYRVRIVLRPTTGPSRTVVKNFVIRTVAPRR